MKKMNLKSKTLILMSLLMMTGLRLFAQETPADTTPTVLPGVQILWWVQPEQKEAAFSVSSINKEEIKTHIGNGSVNNIFDRIPSMITTSDAGTGIGYNYMRIRGIDQTRINVTVNGVALNDAESQGSWFVNLPDFGSKVQHLDVQRGAGTSNNGAAAFGASMNFYTLFPSTKPYAEISSSAGSFYTFRNAISVGTGLIKKRFSADVAYSNVMSRGYIENASARLHSLFFTANYILLNEKKNKDYGRLQFNLLYGNEKTGLAWNGVPSDMLATDRRYNSCGLYTDDNGNVQHYDNETDNYQQTHYQLHYMLNRAAGSRGFIDFKASLHLTRGIGYYEEYKEDKKFKKYNLQSILGDSTANYVSDFVTRKWLDNYFYGGAFNLKHTIRGGATATKRHTYTWMVGGAANRYDGKHYGSLEWMQYNYGVDKSWHWYDGTGSKQQYNLYGKFIYNLGFDTEKILGGLNTYADLQMRGIRYDITGINSDLMDITQNHKWIFVNPKVGVDFNWNKRESKWNHDLYFAFSTANREPTRADLTDADKVQRPKPETMYDFELGYLLHGPKYDFSANAYFMYYIDQLVLTGEINAVGAAIMTNADRSYRTGIELVSSYRPVKWFAWEINGTFSLNKILDYTEYVDDWDNGGQIANYLGTTNISFSPSIVANNEFVFTPVKNFDISFITKFVSRQYIDNSARKEYSIDPYCVNNLQLSYTINTKPIPEIGLFFQVNNIFNAKYESNAWLYRYYYGGEECRDDGYFPQAGINFMGGVKLKW